MIGVFKEIAESYGWEWVGNSRNTFIIHKYLNGGFLSCKYVVRSDRMYRSGVTIAGDYLRVVYPDNFNTVPPGINLCDPCSLDLVHEEFREMKLQCTL